MSSDRKQNELEARLTQVEALSARQQAALDRLYEFIALQTVEDLYEHLRLDETDE